MSEGKGIPRRDTGLRRESEFQPSRHMRRLMRMVVASPSDTLPGDQPLTAEEFKKFAHEFEKHAQEVHERVARFAQELSTPYAQAKQDVAKNPEALNVWMGFVERNFATHRILKAVFLQYIGEKESARAVRESDVEQLYKMHPQAPTMDEFSEQITLSEMQVHLPHIPALYDGFCKLFYGKRYEYIQSWEQGVRAYVASRPTLLEEDPITPTRPESWHPTVEKGEQQVPKLVVAVGWTKEGKNIKEHGNAWDMITPEAPQDAARVPAKTPPRPAEVPDVRLGHKEQEESLVLVSAMERAQLVAQDRSGGCLLENHSKVPRHESDWMVDAGIAPHFKTVFEGKTWYFSKPFLYGRNGRGDRVNRMCAVVFVPIVRGVQQWPWSRMHYETHWVARPYYVSGSSGMWRYLNGYTYMKDQNGRGFIDHLGKGKGTDLTLNLPFALQEQLTNALDGGHNTPPDGESILMGLTDNKIDRFPEPFTHAGEVKEDRPRQPMCSEAYEVRRGVEPKDIALKEDGDMPDFQRRVHRWSLPSELYGGRVFYDVFIAKNGQQQFCFAHDMHGRRWIAGVEDITAETGSTGVRTHWVDVGAANIPAMEYVSEIVSKMRWPVPYAEKETNTSMKRHLGAYADISAFTNHIPMVEEYGRWLEQQRRGGE